MPSSFIRAHVGGGHHRGAGRSLVAVLLHAAALLAPRAAALHVPGSASHAYSEQGRARKGTNCNQNGHPSTRAMKVKQNMKPNMDYRVGQAVQNGGNERTCSGS